MCFGADLLYMCTCLCVVQGGSEAQRRLDVAKKAVEEKKATPAQQARVNQSHRYDLNPAAASEVRALCVCVCVCVCV